MNLFVNPVRKSIQIQIPVSPNLGVRLQSELSNEVGRLSLELGALSKIPKTAQKAEEIPSFPLKIRLSAYLRAIPNRTRKF